MDQELVSKLKRLSLAYQKYINFKPEDKSNQIPVPVKPDIPPLVDFFNQGGKEMPPVSLESFRKTQICGFREYDWGSIVGHFLGCSVFLLPLVIFGAIYLNNDVNIAKIFGIVCFCLGIIGYFIIFVCDLGWPLLSDAITHFESKKTVVSRYEDYCAETNSYNRELREYRDKKDEYDLCVKKEKKRFEDDLTITKSLYQSDYLSLLSDGLIEERYVSSLPTIISLLECGAVDTIDQAEKIIDMRNR